MVNRQINRRDKDAGRGGFDYTPSDPKKLKERAERRGGGFDTYFNGGFQMFRAKQGENAIRIMPPTWKGHQHFGLEIWVHGFIGLDRSSYLCPKKMLGKKCAICEAAAEALSAGEKEDSDELKAKMKVLYWILDREGDSGDPQPWAVSGQFDQEVSGRCNKRSGKVLEVDNPWEGHDVTFRRTGQQLATRYINVDVDPDRTAIADREKETQRLLDFVQDNPLDKILKYYDYDHLHGAIAGKSKDEDEDLDDDGDKKGRKRRADADEDDGDRSSKRRGSRDEEDEGAESDRPKRSRSRDDDDEKEDRRRSKDEDEEETPRRRRSRDEDEDEEDDRKHRARSRDEDEDERPRKNRREDDSDADEDRGSKPRNKREREDDEDEARPRGKRSRADDDDEGDDDRDEDPPSSRRAKRGRD
jgi:hypothetical protein